MKSLLGVDIGTQGTKAALFDAQGVCLAQAFEASRLLSPQGGVVEEDPERQVGSVCRTIRQCMEKSGLGAGEVAGIGIDGQMAGVIGIGGNGRCVTPYDSWLDTRCAPQIAFMEQRAGAEVLAQTGCAPSFNHGPKILWWKQERKRVYPQVTAFVQPGGYAAMRLCGLGLDQAFIDQTYLHFSGFADNAAARWDAGLCERFGVDEAKLPRIVAPQEVVGELSKTMAGRCGLKPGVPVVAGCGDTAASFLACGAVKVGVGVDVAGTASVFAATTREFRPDHKERMLGCGRSAVPGLWHPYAYINGGGLNLAWFQRELGGLTRGRSGKKDSLTFEQLDAEAGGVVERGDNPYFVPHLGGRVCPTRPGLRGAWFGLGWEHTRGHLYRAVLEAVALEYAVYQRVLQELYPRMGLRELRITGGGEKSGVWNRIKADTLQIAVKRIQGSVGAPSGAAMLAGWGVGVLRDLPTAAVTWVQTSAALRPRPGKREHYLTRRKTYETILKVMETIMQREVHG